MINVKRIQKINHSAFSTGGIVYWMSRDQRVVDNWALLYAQELAQKHTTSLAVVFCLREVFDYATERIVDFMLTGLQEVEQNLKYKHIPFYFLLGDPATAIPQFVRDKRVGALVSDFSPLRYARSWKKHIAKSISVPLYEVDAHNIIPVWVHSQKQEFGAYTIRPKIQKLLPEFLEEFPQLKEQKYMQQTPHIDWGNIYKRIQIDHSVKKITWLASGEKAAQKAMIAFLEHHLEKYALERNDPNKHAQSDLSPYIHFGQISSARITLKARTTEVPAAAKKAFLEEIIIRKELSDNYCLSNTHYDSPRGFPAWAQKTLADHQNDKREYIYSQETLEQAQTSDQLWNAAQREMVYKGKMHGYMRMYWAKKILEWSTSAEIAQKQAIYLNDKYFLDGRDPNGYTGIAWAIGGLHDRAWFERSIFGKVRYMNYNGAKRKFDVEKYIASNRLKAL